MEVKFKIGKYLYPVSITEQGSKFLVKFPFNREILAEIKAMKGAQWDPTNKVWSIEKCARNQFNLDYLIGKNPYAKYETALQQITPVRPLYAHQKEMLNFAWTRHYCIFACEMGSGKTLPAGELIERAGYPDFWYVSTKSGVVATRAEFRKWGFKIMPVMMTYDELKTVTKNWNRRAPRGVIFDESSKIKNAKSQRSQAAMHLADAIRAEHGDTGYVILMSGSPTPKDPTDWWHQVEVTCPGFLRESDSKKLERRLSKVVMDEGPYGTYPKRITWWDDESKCAECGLPKDDVIHLGDPLFPVHGAHKWKPSVNEVQALGRRLSGLAIVKYKKDCLDLPEKVYRIVRCKPSAETIKLARFLLKSSARVIEGMIKVRELSDGFQYSEEPTGKDVACPLCKGEGKTYLLDTGTVGPCPNCEGTGKIPEIIRIGKRVESQKVEALKDLLDEVEDVGRVIVFAGFVASVDLCTDTLLGEGWDVIRIDGRGWAYLTKEAPESLTTDQMYARFQDKTWTRKLGVVAHPKSGGMSLTLTAAPMEIYYSNTFDGEDRIQSEDRAHRPGMDVNRGLTIVDIINLETDSVIRENLMNKKNLQAMSVDQIRNVNATAIQSLENQEKELLTNV